MQSVSLLHLPAAYSGVALPTWEVVTEAAAAAAMVMGLVAAVVVGWVVAMEVGMAAGCRQGRQQQHGLRATVNHVNHEYGTEITDV